MASSGVFVCASQTRQNLLNVKSEKCTSIKDSHYSFNGQQNQL